MDTALIVTTGATISLRALSWVALPVFELLSVWLASKVIAEWSFKEASEIEPVVQVPPPEQATLPVTSAPPAGELNVYETFPSPVEHVPVTV